MKANSLADHPSRRRARDFLKCDEKILHLNDQFIYMYKGFTHVNYRVQRLRRMSGTSGRCCCFAAGLGFTLG